MEHIVTENHKLLLILNVYFIKKRKRFLFWSYWKTILRTKNQNLAVEYFRELEPLKR